MRLPFSPVAAGAFPPAYVPTATAYLPSGAQPVPVYAAAGADADDTLVRTYAKCPAYVDRLNAWCGPTRRIRGRWNLTAT